jgi:Tfp pilus assembly protein PilF
MHAANSIRFNEFNQSVQNFGVDKAIHEYIVKQKQNPRHIAFNEPFLRGKGYSYLNAGKIEDAKKIFALNMKSYPHSWTVYNNMAEAFQRGGEIDSAKFYYNKSLKIKPENNWATAVLKTL